MIKIYSQRQIQNLSQRPSLLQRQKQKLSLDCVSQFASVSAITCLTESSISVKFEEKRFQFKMINKS